MKPYFCRIGGKGRLLSKITPFLPDEMEVYCEPFIGGGAVFLSKDKWANIEVINDIDRDIYDLWNDISTVSQEAVNSMDWYNDTDKSIHFINTPPPTDPIERFYRNMYISVTTFGGNRKSPSVSKGNRNLYTGTAFRNIDKYHKRLDDVIIRNQDYTEIIEEFDSPNTFFYLDPPYSKMNKSWGYTSLISNKNLLEQLRNIKGLFCMSYDFSEHNMELFDEFNIEIFDNTYSINSFDSRKKAREIIIMNY
jgi:DNA adenine methylase